MNALMHRWTLATAALITVFAIGCRGSRPFGRFVQVTKEADAAQPDISAPAQRLASAKPRTGSNLGIAKQRQSANRSTPTPQDDSPHIRMTASKSPARPTSTTKTQPAPSRDQKRVVAKTPSQRSTDRTPTTSRQSERKTTDRKRVTSKLAAAPNQKASERTADSNLSQPEEAELMDAFSDYPPEVQREALRRLVAATSKSAKRSTLPNEMKSKLADMELPTLPDELDQDAPEVPPHRLASDKKAANSAVASVTDLKPESTPKSEESASVSVTDLVTTEIESAVQTISDSAPVSEVKTASASKSKDDSKMIARANVESESIEPPKVKEPTVPKNSKPLSEFQLYEQLLSKLSKPAAGESEAERASRMIKLRHLLVLAGKPDDAVGAIEGMSKNEQEYLRHQLLGLWTMIDPEGHPVPSRRFSTAVPQIREAAKFAAASTDSLEVRALAFCTEIISYGQIKPFEGNRFDANQQVILYCEIENFSAMKVDEGYETHLQGSYDIYDSDDNKVISQLLPADQQISANYLRDYFIAYQMHLPDELEPGTYRLQLTMEDIQGKKYGQSSVPFEIAK